MPFLLLKLLLLLLLLLLCSTRKEGLSGHGHKKGKFSDVAPLEVSPGCLFD